LKPQEFNIRVSKLLVLVGIKATILKKSINICAHNRRLHAVSLKGAKILSGRENLESQEFNIRVFELHIKGQSEISNANDEK